MHIFMLLGPLCTDVRFLRLASLTSCGGTTAGLWTGGPHLGDESQQARSPGETKGDLYSFIIQKSKD